MLCRNCRCQIARSDDVCTVCGTPVKGRAPLELVIGDGRRIPLVYGPLTLGRGSENLIRIAGETVSRNHARIVIDPAGPAVEDAGSTYGTFVDGHQITGRTLLRDGSTLGLGDVKLTIEAKRHESASGRTVVFGAIPRPARRGRRGAPLPAAACRLEAEAARRGRGRSALRPPRAGRPLRAAERRGRQPARAAGRRELAVEPDRGRNRALRPGRARASSPRCWPTSASGACSRASRRRRRRPRRRGSPDSSGCASGTSRGSARSSRRSTAPAASCSSPRRRWSLFALVSAAGLVAFADLIGSGTVAPFVVAGKVGVGGIVFLVGRFLVVDRARVRSRAHRRVVRPQGAEGRDQADADLPVRLRGHLGGLVRAGAAADRDQRRRADQRPHDRRRGGAARRRSRRRGRCRTSGSSSPSPPTRARSST